MIVSQTFYGIKCNRCGKICTDGEYTYWSDKDSAIENANDSEWLQRTQNNHYCPNCHDYENDTPYAHFPEPLKLVQKYVEKILEGYDFIVRDTPTTTLFIKQIPKKLLEFEKLWIKEVAGDLLINIQDVESQKKLVTTPILLIIEFKNPK